MPQRPRNEKQPGDVTGAAEKVMLMLPVTPEWLFAQGGVRHCGVVEWKQPVPERGPGVYVVTAPHPPTGAQRVVYVGRTRCLSRRLRQFYRHKYGASSPHRGGQEILTLSGLKIVHWARTKAFAEAERLMLQAFRSKAGVWPLGNRINSARMAAVSSCGTTGQR